MEEQVCMCLLLKENSSTSTFWNKQEDANMKKGEIRQSWAGLEMVKGASRKVKMEREKWIGMRRRTVIQAEG